MDLKKWCFVLFVSGIFNAQAEPLVWKASKGPQTFFIIGTVHLGNASMYPLPQVLIDNLMSSDAVVIEADLTEPVTMPTATNHQSLKSSLNSKEFAQLKRIATNSGMNVETITALAPWQVALVLQNHQFQSLGFHSDYGVDSTIVKMATKHDIPVHGLESLQFQIDLLSKQEDDGVNMLKQTLTEWDESGQNVECLIESWKMGDIQNLNQLLDEASKDAKFEQDFIVNRNYDWVEKLNSDPVFSSGTFTVAVGTLHLVGQESLLNLLKKAQYHVKLLTLPKKSHCKIEME
ncbi:TraB/GumN family protein [Vibrio sp. E150_011]